MLIEPPGKKVSGHPLSGSLFTELRKEILQGKFKPGEKLSEQQLSDLYNLSRTPVREAFLQLEQEGLIETIPNRGAYVIGLSKQDISDLYDMRKAFEILAVAWAIERIKPEELEQLKEAYEFMEFYTLKKDADKMLEINMDFHNQIYRSAHNRILSHSLSTYQLYLKESQTSIAYLDDYLNVVLNEHKRIYDAFTNRDPKAGVRAITIHLNNAKQRAISG